MKKTIIGIAVLLAIVVVAFLLFNGNWRKDTSGAVLKDSIDIAEVPIFTGYHNISSVSSDSGDDTIIIENDPGATYTSVSVGNVLRFDGTLLTEGVNYFVRTASVSDRFEVSLVPGGTVVDLASSDGSNMFYQSANTNILPVDGLEYITISVDAEEAPSASLKFVGSIQNTAPNFYASQSLTNRWDEIYSNDLETSTGVAGATGYTLSTTDTHKIYKIYVSQLKWISAIVDRYASGSLDIRANGAK